MPKVARNVAAGEETKHRLRYTRHGQWLRQRCKSRMSSKTRYQTFDRVKTLWVLCRAGEILEAFRVPPCRMFRDFTVGSGICACEVTHTGFAVVSSGSHSFSRLKDSFQM